MKTTLFSVILSLSLLSLPSQACAPPNADVLERHRRMNANTLHRAERRQVGVQPPTQSTGANTAPVPTDPFAVIPASQISAQSPPEVTPPLPITPTAGQQPPISGAPPLPSLTIQASAYPPENTVPPVDSPQVTQWMKEIAGIDPAILNVRPTVDGTCQNDTAAAADLSRCWWTCGGCTNTTEDITTCPDKNTWGVSFDDGPAPYTPKVMHYLQQQNLTGTFFVVGSRLMERPSFLQAEYMLGHHVAVHTWSHSIPLTALSNAQVVAELGWCRKAIKEITGVTPLYMRPPWGDIDNRVRAISLAMGMQPIIWTREPTTLAQFDTNDWRVVAGQITGTDSVASFQYILGNASLLNTGFTVLEHDLFQQEVDLSTGTFLPTALSKGFKLMDINACQHKAPSEAYLETIQNKSGIPFYPGAGPIDVAGDGSNNGGNPAVLGGNTNSPSGNTNGGSSGGSTQGGSSGGSPSSPSAGVALRVSVGMLGAFVVGAAAMIGLS